MAGARGRKITKPLRRFHLEFDAPARSHRKVKNLHGSERAAPRECGEGELVSGVHTLVAGVVQVYHRLQVLEEEEKGRKVEQEMEREDPDEENAQMTMHMEMV